MNKRWLITDFFAELFGQKSEPKVEQQVWPRWEIDKQFSFCYGHRVWSQKLEADFCETGDTSCKCRHLHGHEGLVHIFLASNELERGMVTDFKHLGWLKNLLDDYIDHKFIMDLNDPWFAQVTNLKLYRHDEEYHAVLFKPTTPLNTTSDVILWAMPVYVPGTEFIIGWELNVSAMQGPEQEFFESFFLVDFLPTSENLSRWLYHVVQAKMDQLGIHVVRVDWNETPKSRSSYSEQTVVAIPSEKL